MQLLSFLNYVDVYCIYQAREYANSKMKKARIFFDRAKFEFFTPFYQYLPFEFQIFWKHIYFPFRCISCTYYWVVSCHFIRFTLKFQHFQGTFCFPRYYNLKYRSGYCSSCYHKIPDFCRRRSWLNKTKLSFWEQDHEACEYFIIPLVNWKSKWKQETKYYNEKKNGI